jgi:hypothetical protein
MEDGVLTCAPAEPAGSDRGDGADEDDKAAQPPRGPGHSLDLAVARPTQGFDPMTTRQSLLASAVDAASGIQPMHDDEDPAHPIASPEVIDGMVIGEDGGATLVIVVASPLMPDPRSQKRLMLKIRSYLGYIGSADFRAEAGVPTPATTRIAVKLHPGSSPAIHDLLERCVGWATANDVSLEVQLLDATDMQGAPTDASLPGSG